MRSRFATLRRPACGQCPPVVRRHRERLAVAGDVQGRRKALCSSAKASTTTSTSRSTSTRQSDLIITEAREAVAAAQRANVNVYGIDPAA